MDFYKGFLQDESPWWSTGPTNYSARTDENDTDLPTKLPDISAYVWLGSQGVVTPAHFDAVHNFYIQIHGHKRFMLFPPTSVRQLYPHPVLHPNGRQTQINIDEPDSSFDLLYHLDGLLNESEAVNSLTHQDYEFTIAARDVTLGPGDVLYLPPYWAHHVTALDTR